MATGSSTAKEGRAKVKGHYAVAKRILDACSSVLEDWKLKKFSENAVRQFLKDERYFQWKVAEVLDSERREFELEYRPSSSKDKRSIRIDAVVKDKDGGKVLVEMKKQRRWDDPYVPTSVQDQFLRLVIQTQLEGGLAMFLWIGDDRCIGHWDDFLDFKDVPACKWIDTDRNDMQKILEKVRIRLGMKSDEELIEDYGEKPVTDMRFSGIRIYRMDIDAERVHHQLYIQVWIIDPKYWDVEYRPAWITSETQTADIRFSIDSKFGTWTFMRGGIRTEKRCWLTNVKIIYQEEKKR